MNSRSFRAFASEGLVLVVAAIVCGFVEAALIQTHRATAVDPFHDVPARVWIYVPLAWLCITVLLAIPAYAVSRKRAAHLLLSALTAVLVGCRVALFSRKWAVIVIAVVFVLVLTAAVRIPLPRARRPLGWLAALAVCLGAAFLAVRPRDQIRRPLRAASGPNVLVVIADTLRYDAVFLPDATVRPELPALRRFAGESTVYDRAYAPSSWTLPSHMAMVTGLDAHETRVDFDHQTFERPVATLAELFRRRGYRTAAVLSNPFLHEHSGFARGFDDYEHAARALDVCRTAPLVLLAQLWPRFAGTDCGWSASQVAGRAARHMQDSEAPWFVLLNFMDAHEPSYLEPECRAVAARRHNTLLSLRVREAPLYHAAVRCLDRSLGPLFDRAALTARPTVVVFLSDHGEHLHERGFMGHGQTLYPEVLHVPLMVRRPGRERARFLEPVSLSQLPALLSSRSWTIAPPPVVTSTLTHSAAEGRRRDVSVIRGSWQLITRDGGSEELLDLRSGATVRDAPILPQLRADTASVQRAWPRLSAGEFRSVGYIH